MYKKTMASSNLTSGFIDLATYDEIEKYMYGGADATTYFVRETRRSTWFTHVPVQLSKGTGNPSFGGEFSVNISRAGDYLLNCWLRVTLPEVKVGNYTDDSGNSQKNSIAWVPNVGHNMIEEVTLRFNDLVAATLNNYVLDFWSEFTVPAGKRSAYAAMTGMDLGGNFTAGDISSRTLNIPLPLFFTRDTGVALPTAALPYNEMRLHLKLANIERLLMAQEIDATTKKPSGKIIPCPNAYLSSTTSMPQLSSSDVNVWADYAIVSNEERQKMACAPRDMVIEQFQTNSPNSYTRTGQPSFDIRFSHAIKALMFGISEETMMRPNVPYSNYSTTAHSISSGAIVKSSQNPLASVSLVYENTNRLADMGSDYFTHVCPYYNAPCVPDEVGYHLYSYSLDMANLDPMGSTNYGKLTNVSLQPKPTAGTNNLPAGRLVVVAVNNNVVRVSGGALGFPVL